MQLVTQMTPGSQKELLMLGHSFHSSFPLPQKCNYKTLCVTGMAVMVLCGGIMGTPP